MGEGLDAPSLAVEVEEETLVGAPTHPEPLGDGGEVAHIGPEPPDAGGLAGVASDRRNVRGRDANHVYVGMGVDVGCMRLEDGRCPLGR